MITEIRQILLDAGYARAPIGCINGFRKDDEWITWVSTTRAEIKFQARGHTVRTTNHREAKCLIEALIQPDLMPVCLTFEWARPIVEKIMTTK